MTTHRLMRRAAWSFAVAGILALGYCLAVSLEAHLFENRAAQDFARELRLKGPATWAPPVPASGGVIGQLDIPRIGLSVMVVQGVGSKQLRVAAGHIPGTALPAEAGNVGIAGHRDTFFRSLRFIHTDDMIALRTLRATYHYKVVSTRVVRPEDIRVLDPGGDDSLTLVTCYPFYYVGPAPERFIVRAERVPATG